MPEPEDFDVALVRAGNPGPFTLSGTNTWLLGRDPTWVVDPGPAIADHLDAVLAEAQRRGGVGGIALTHDHADHAAGAGELRQRAGNPPLAAARRGLGSIALTGGDVFGPFVAVATPGHAPDHLAFVAGEVCFTGDAVLGEGSVFISPDPGALRGYLDGLRRLRALPLALICPGHGPPVPDPAAGGSGHAARAPRQAARGGPAPTGRRRAAQLAQECGGELDPPPLDGAGF